MPKKVYNNIVGHKLIDNNKECEDITSITLPSIQFSTTTMDAMGMVGAIDVPNSCHVNASSYSIAHNNGTNCQYLHTPGLHNTELRLARQRYNVALAAIEHESVKFRLRGMFTGTEQGTVERENPLGSTENYSTVRMEREIAGKVDMVIDYAAGIIKINGKSYSNDIENLLK